MPQRSKTYYRYLIPYVALLLAAVLALFIFSECFFVVQLEDSLLDAQRGRVGQTVQQLDSELQQIYTIDYQISSVNENFLSYYLSDPSPMRDLRIVNEFKNLLAPSTFISEIALLEQDNESVYTSTAVYSKRLFFDSIFSFDTWLDTVGDLAALKSRIVRPAEAVNGSRSYITFINRPSVFSRLQDAALLFFVDESYFLSRLAPEGSGQQGAIWDAQGQLIVSTLPLTEPVAESRLRLNGTSYLVMQQESTVTDWIYAFLLPENIYLQPIHRARVVLLVFILAMLVLGSLLIHYAMQVNYKPLQQLTLSLGGSLDGDELESLRDVVDSLSQQNERMRSQLMSSPDGQALKDALLFSLLKGKFASFEDYNREARALDMTFNMPCYHVMMLRYFGQDEEVSRPQLAAALDRTLGADFPCRFRELFEPSMIVCLVGLEAEREQEFMARCRTLLETCAQDYSLSFTIGMSECYSDIRHISTACFEATQAVREYFIRGHQQLIPYRELNQTLPRETSYLSDLRNLTELPPEEQLASIQRSICRLIDQKAPALLAKSYCNSALQLLISSAARPVQTDDLFSINYLRTVDDYLAFIEHLLTRTPEPTPESEQQQPSTELLGRIQSYVAENYDDCNFSLQDAADKLGLSSSYLSQHFKQQTGETLTSYVASLRIRKAQSLLETTNMPLQVVSESIGYYNLNSFIRRFKQITGVTPGEWRKSHQSFS